MDRGGKGYQRYCRLKLLKYGIGSILNRDIKLFIVALRDLQPAAIARFKRM
jgi:hypothetical protein